MNKTEIEARVEKGKLVPLKPIELPEGRIVRIKIESLKKDKEKFLNALQKLKGTIKGSVFREEWYEQANLY